MSHKGNPAPVLFRRDWNMNVNNYNQGYANRYRWKPIHVTTGIGTFIDQFTWEMGPATKTAFSIMSWTSPVISFGIFDFITSLTAEITNGGKGYLKLIHVVEQHVGEIYTGQMGSVSDLFPEFNDSSHTGVSTFVDPHFYDGDPRYFGGPFKKKLWTDGPPH